MYRTSHTQTMLHTDNTPVRDDIVFLSPHKSLIAKGRAATLTLPAADGHHADGLFQQQLRQLFREASASGIAHPIVVGAIPFDKERPSFLTLPTSVEWIERSACPPLSSPVSIAGEIQPHPGKAAFCAMVDDALNRLNDRMLDKVVLSRLLKIDAARPIDALHLWQAINQQNPAGYNFHLPLGESTLIGASPELLLRKQGNRITSCPLAGSARRGRDSATDQQAQAGLLASAKDAHEHRIVAQAIHRRLHAHCDSLEIPAPSLMSTPTLWHLATHVEATVNNPAENALSLACRLHPTPALCGTPWPQARQLIHSLEPFDRGWFGGIVGWCDSQGNGEWVVTIRCGEVHRQQITLFAGAGIVPGSQPESEWHETGVKLSTMLHALGITPQQDFA